MFFVLAEGHFEGRAPTSSRSGRLDGGSIVSVDTIAWCDAFGELLVFGGERHRVVPF